MILVTGASGSIGSRLTDRLAAAARGPLRLAGREPAKLRSRWPDLESVELDVLRPETMPRALEGVDAAYYLVHSMEPSAGGDFHARDAQGARDFARVAREAGVRRVIYLGGLGDERHRLSEHLRSRQETGRILAAGGPPVVEFRAAMVLAGDSASFRMLDDLVRRLPAMVVPRWVSTPSQPIAVQDVLAYLERGVDVALDRQHTIVEVGGPDRVTYKEMIAIVAEREGRRRPPMIEVPLLTPRLSSYWCGLTTSVPAALARPLIEGLATPMVVTNDSAARRFPDIEPVSFREGLDRAMAEAKEQAEEA
ncbi:MAG: NAD(P)H-binding protein [Actinomycetota bacterium]